MIRLYVHPTKIWHPQPWWWEEKYLAAKLPFHLEVPRIFSTASSKMVMSLLQGMRVVGHTKAQRVLWISMRTILTGLDFLKRSRRKCQRISWMTPNMYGPSISIQKTRPFTCLLSILATASSVTYGLGCSLHPITFSRDMMLGMVLQVVIHLLELLYLM